jgi:hypothetical protein
MTLRGKALFALAAFSTLALAGSHQPAYAYYHYYSSSTANFLDVFEYKVEIDAGELMGSKQARGELAKNQPRDIFLDRIERKVMGFSVSATDVKIHMTPSRMDADRTRLDLDIEGKDVAVKSSYFNKKFAKMDIDTIYGVYDAKTDKVTVHIPFATAFSLAFK